MLALLIPDVVVQFDNCALCKHTILINVTNLSGEVIVVEPFRWRRMSARPTVRRICMHCHRTIGVSARNHTRPSVGANRSTARYFDERAQNQETLITKLEPHFGACALFT